MTSTTSRDLTALRDRDGGRGHRSGARGLRRGPQGLERRHRPPPGGDRALHVGAGRRGGRPVRDGGGAGDRRARRRRTACRARAWSTTGWSSTSRRMRRDQRRPGGPAGARRRRARSSPTSTRPPRSTGSPCPAGFVGHTGVAGLTLGGGMGWLTRTRRPDDRQHDLRRGRPRRRPRSCGPPPTRSPDLFWALRGGGGNFGVVTEFEFRCHPVGPMIQFGMFFWGVDQGVEAMRFMRDLAARSRASSRRRSARSTRRPRPSCPRSSSSCSPVSC